MIWLLRKDFEVSTNLIGTNKEILIDLSIQDIHIIFWLKFNCVNYLFRICIFASNANKNIYAKMLINKCYIILMHFEIIYNLLI